jgi:dephospho-CoA kinase
MLILGITGGVATGKSTVTEMFADLGAAVVSADQIAHELLRPGSPLSAKVVRAFPECRDPFGRPPDQPSTFPGGSHIQFTSDAVDRRALARLIFADPKARKRLERITHPPIIAQLRQQIDALRPLESPPLAAVEIPLLFEAKLTKLVDRIVVVTCAEELQIRRLEERTGISRDDALRQIGAQWPLERKIKLADHIISTDGTLDETRDAVLAVWQDLLYFP